MNEFIKEKTIAALKKATTDDFKSYILKQSETLNELNIDNEKDLLRYHYLAQLIPIYSKNLFGYINKSACKTILNKVVKSDLSLSDTLDKISEEFNSNITKVAYPNVFVGEVEFPNYNISKWIKALNDIYIRARVFGNKLEAIQYVTKDWSDMDEIERFKDWVKIYEECGKNMHKSSQISFPMIPGLIKSDQEKIPQVKQHNPTMQEELQKTKNQILGRIQSAKKILSTSKGQLFAGEQYRSLYRMLLDLENDIAVIKTAAGLDDVIIRARGTLISKGCNDTTINVFNKIAQEIPTPDQLGAPMGSPAGDPSAAPAPDSAEKGKQAIEEFAENLRQNISETEVKEANLKWWETESSLSDLNKVAAKLQSIISDIFQTSSKTTVFDTIKIAQVMPSQNAMLDDDVIYKALDGIKLKDVIDRLQALSKVFKNREIARQLFIIDLMLDKLGISGFFPQLAEATKSALESNQYAQNRIEEILSKLLSATDEAGRSLITKTPVDSNSIVDKEMEQYLNPKEVISPKVQKAKPEVTPAEPAAAPKPPTKPPVAV